MPIKTFYPDGITTMFDSDAVRGGICLGLFDVPAGTAFSRSFPLLAGATLRVCRAEGRTDGLSPVSIDNSGSPTVTSAAVAYDRQLMIWADGTPSIQSLPGMQALNDQFNVALSPAGRGLLCVGKASYDTFVARQTVSGVTYAAYWRIRISCPTRPVAVVDLSGGISVFKVPPFQSLGGGVWQTTITAVAGSANLSLPPSALATPDVYCFAMPQAAAAGGAMAAIYDEDSSLAYDLLAGRLLFSAAQISIAPSEITASMALDISRSIPVMAKPGVFGSASYRRYQQRTANSADHYEAVWSAGSGSVSLRSGLAEVDTDSGTVGASFLQPRSSGAFAEIIDLSQY